MLISLFDGAGGGAVVAVPGPAAAARVAHVGHPLSFTLAFLPGACINPAGPAPPVLFLTVQSVEGPLQRVEGYAAVEVPCSGAGGCDLVARCWAPWDEGAQEADFFLAGAVRLTDVSEARVPAGWGAGAAWRDAAPGTATPAALVQAAVGAGAGAGAIGGGARLSRFGAATRTTGEVGLRLHCVRQGQPQHHRAGGGGHHGGGGRHGSGGGGAAAHTGAVHPARPTKTVEEILERSHAVRRTNRGEGGAEPATPQTALT